jgi:hypothetical protein
MDTPRTSATRTTSAIFSRGSWDAIDADRSVAVRLCPRAKRDRVTHIILSEWEMLNPSITELPDGVSPGDFREALTRNVRTRIRQQEWGFIWWLPLVMMVAEAIIRLLIERWLKTS